MPMRTSTDSGTSGANAHARLHLVLGIVGLIGPVLTFILAISSLEYNYKIAGLVGFATVYLSICIWSYGRSRAAEAEPLKFEKPSKLAGDVPARLLSLREANEFFGSSLKPADMFRLVSSRVGEVCEFSASALFVFNGTRTKLRISQADGRNAGLLQNLELDADAGLAGMAAVSREVEKDGDMMIERFSLPDEALDGFLSAVAIPLMHDG
ncbi:MAG: hypothetical protein ABIU09_12355, partial [Pyrinomonadaceae bacterium]